MLQALSFGTKLEGTLDTFTHSLLHEHALILALPLATHRVATLRATLIMHKHSDTYTTTESVT